MFSPVTHHWVDRIPPLQSWFSSQLPCLCPGENKCVPGSRYKHRLQVEEQHLCDVLPMKVKKLNLKDQRCISGNLKRNSQGLSMLTKGIEDLWRGASTAVAIVRLDEQRGHLSDFHRRHSNVPAFDHLDWNEGQVFDQLQRPRLVE